jgi:hypothetical protein
MHADQGGKYTQQLTIDVGDMPNHLVRVFEVRYTFPLATISAAVANKADLIFHSLGIARSRNNFRAPS